MIPVIPDVNNGIKKIPDISIPSYITNPPSALPIYPPVTTEIGVPVVNLPGCVEAIKIVVRIKLSLQMMMTDW